MLHTSITIFRLQQPTNSTRFVLVSPPSPLELCRRDCLTRHRNVCATITDQERNDDLRLLTLECVSASDTTRAISHSLSLPLFIYHRWSSVRGERTSIPFYERVKPHIRRRQGEPP